MNLLDIRIEFVEHAALKALDANEQHLKVSGQSVNSLICQGDRPRPHPLSRSSVYWHSNLVTFSDWLRMLAHIDTGNRKFDARGNRTHNLAVWSRTRYQCDTTSKLTSWRILPLAWRKWWRILSAQGFLKLSRMHLGRALRKNTLVGFRV